jgi:hypothetical protein
LFKVEELECGTGGFDDAHLAYPWRPFKASRRQGDAVVTGDGGRSAKSASGGVQGEKFLVSDIFD